MKNPQKYFNLTLSTIFCIALVTAGCTLMQTKSVNSMPESKNVDTNISQGQSQPNNSDEKNASLNSANIQKDKENSPLKQEILYDFREIDKFRPPTKFLKVEERLVLNFAYGAVKRDLSGTDSLQQRFDGSFSQSDKHETLYLANGGGDEPQKKLVIYEGTTPLYKLVFDGQEIIKIVDLDNDGRSELLITTGDVYLYGRELDLQIIRINQKGIETLKSFQKVVSSSDSEGHESTLAEVSAISFTPTSEKGIFPTQYSLKSYDCKGVAGSIDSKTCRAK